MIGAYKIIGVVELYIEFLEQFEAHSHALTQIIKNKLSIRFRLNSAESIEMNELEVQVELDRN